MRLSRTRSFWKYCQTPLKTKESISNQTKKKNSKRAQEFIRERVAELPPLQKAVIHLAFWEDLNLRKIAHRLGKKATEIEAIRDIALEELREDYLREFGE